MQRGGSYVWAVPFGQSKEAQSMSQEQRAAEQRECGGTSAARCLVKE